MPADITPEALAEIERSPGRPHRFQVLALCASLRAAWAERDEARAEARDLGLRLASVEGENAAHRLMLHNTLAERDRLQKRISAHKSHCGCLCFCEECEERRELGEGQ